MPGGVHRIQHVGRQFARRIDARRGRRQQRRELAGAGDMVGCNVGCPASCTSIGSFLGSFCRGRYTAAPCARKAGGMERRSEAANSPWTAGSMLAAIRGDAGRPRGGPAACDLRPAWRRRSPRCGARHSCRRASVDAAYDNRPLPIGHGQTISQPFIVALMTELLDLQPDDTRAGGRHRLGLPGGGARRAGEQGLLDRGDPGTGAAAPPRRWPSEGYGNVMLRIGDGALRLAGAGTVRRDHRDRRGAAISRRR